MTDHAVPLITVNEVGDVVLDDAPSSARWDDVQVELERVLEPYLNRAAEQVPDAARRVRVLAYFLPDRA